ncbi:PucR family transcriptional regulator [Nonomuraea angiospora]|uniref:PucR family transcriptional regulator n=1 Tax=Nonomuraea angiospora TaxID=46172 RepID=UPI0029A05E11|nr:helix-turn-helix domain-containing protein [Nonomuraea angiospora]MDX3101924.1 helix-turn-helix domain-containing protein [Nonomuraea angiospora]
MDLQDLLEDLAQRLGCGLFVDSTDGRLLGYSKQDAHADPARVTSVMSRRVPPEIREWQNRYGISKATEVVRLPPNDELGIRARFCVPIRRDGRCLGYLWIPADGKALDETALGALQGAAAELARALAGRGDEREDLIRWLLDPDRTGEGARDRLAALEPSLLSSEVLICAGVPIGRHRERVPALSATELERLGTALPRVLPCFVTPTHVIALLLSGPSGPTALDEALRKVARRPFAIGIGDPVPFEVRAVRDAYGQARAAAGVAALDPALPRVLPWSGAGPYRMLLPVAPGADPVLVPLKEDAELLRTLETYLDAGCDVQRTAASLHLHRTTVYYRLDRIATTLGADLRDGLVRSHLHLALKARRLSGRPSNGHSVVT